MTRSALEMTDEWRGLLGQLAGIETQERSVLAEVIHDEPIQLIVAAILRIDLLHAHSTGSDAVELDDIATALESSITSGGVAGCPVVDSSRRATRALISSRVGSFLAGITRLHQG